MNRHVTDMSFEPNVKNKLWTLLDEMGEDVEEMYIQIATMMNEKTDISRQIKELYSSYQQYEQTMDQISIILQNEKIKLNQKKQTLIENYNSNLETNTKNTNILHKDMNFQTKNASKSKTSNK